jgi:hypothetical protein
MAVTRLQVFYQIGEGEKWSNVYHVEVSTITDALTAFTSVMQAHLLTLLHSSCRIVKVLSSSLTDDTFQELGVEEAGTSSFTDSRLPLFNCVKVLVSTAGLGRPDIKFMKGWLTEGNSASGSLDTLPLTDFEDEFNAMIGDMNANDTPLTSQTGDLWSTGIVQPTIQMRQMHRRRRPAA